MTEHLRDTDHARMARTGGRRLDNDHALRLFDAVLPTPAAGVLLADLDLPALRRQAAVAPLPAILRGLVRVPLALAAAGGAAHADAGWADRLTGLTPADQQRIVLDLVRGQAATVLGHAGAELIDPGRPFKDLGFDSLTAVELRNRLSATTGIRLPATLVFDFPTPDELAGALHTRVAPPPTTLADTMRDELDRIETALPALERGDGGDPTEVLSRLREMVRRLESRAGDTRTIDTESASDDELFDVLDRFGSSERRPTP